MYLDLNVAYPPTRQQARAMATMAIQLGYDGIVWCKTITGKITAKDTNTMEAVDVSDVWRVSGPQQSVLRLRRPDHMLHAAIGKVDPVAASEQKKAAVDDEDATMTDAKMEESSSSSTSAPASSAAASSVASITAAIASPVAPIIPNVAPNTHGFIQKFRLHINIDDASQLHSLNPSNAALQSYDLISVSAANEKLFLAACSHESVDIVVLEAARKLPFYLKKPPINVAIERGIHFEYSYGQALRDASSRRYLFSNILAFLRLTKGRNIILSSGATKEMEMRAPWDVINLAILCGIEGATSKASVSAHTRAVLLHGEGRKSMKCVLREVSLTPATDQPSTIRSSEPEDVKRNQKRQSMTSTSKQRDGEDAPIKHKDKKMKTQHK